MNKQAKNFQAIYKAIESHNLACDQPPNALMMSYYDIERMEWAEGDVICGLTLTAGGQEGLITVLCDSDEGKKYEEVENVNAVSKDDKLVTV